jgi:hypothetical protein
VAISGGCLRNPDSLPKGLLSHSEGEASHETWTHVFMVR